jgi:hypothetical protein
MSLDKRLCIDELLLNKSIDFETELERRRSVYNGLFARTANNTGSPKLIDAYSRLEDWCLDNQQHNETVMEILNEIDQLRASA